MEQIAQANRISVASSSSEAAQGVIKAIIAVKKITRNVARAENIFIKLKSPFTTDIGLAMRSVAYERGD